MLGFVAAISGLLHKQAYLDSIAASVPKAHRELNLKAFEAGYEYGSNAHPMLPESVEAESAVGATEE